MTDETQNRPGVNLDELERQLRVASRAHSDAAVRNGYQFPTPDRPVTIPDVEALRRDFGRPREAIAPQAEDSLKDPYSPGPPPAFLSQANMHGSNSPGYSVPYDDRFPVIAKNAPKGSGLVKPLLFGIVILALSGAGYYVYSGRLSLGLTGVADQKAVPLIKADTNPVKVIPDTVTKEDSAPSGAELMGKKGTETVTPITTKTSTEAPIDINVAVKDAGSKTPPMVPGMGEPKTVRTVTVRTDGTVIGEMADASSTQTANATPVVPKPPSAAMTQDPAIQLLTVAPASQTAPPAAAQVKTASPTQSPVSLPDLAALTAEVPAFAGQTIPLPPRRPASLNLVAQAELPVDDPINSLVAATTEQDASNPIEEKPAVEMPIGDFAVQFGASPSEAEAGQILAKLKGPLAELLGAHPLTIVKGDSGGKTVYRVRALGFARDAAAATCATAAAAGTKCFIAKN